MKRRHNKLTDDIITYQTLVTLLKDRDWDIHRPPAIKYINVILPQDIYNMTTTLDRTKVTLLCNLGGENYTGTHVDVGGGAAYNILLTDEQTTDMVYIAPKHTTRVWHY